MNLLALSQRSYAFRCLSGVTFLLSFWPLLCQAAGAAEFHRTMDVTSTEPVKLTVDLPAGDLEILYSRDGQVSISAVVQSSGAAQLDENYFSTTLNIEQIGNNITLRYRPSAKFPEQEMKARYRVGVPYRTEVTSVNKSGKLTIRGIAGPVNAIPGQGEVSVSYVGKTVGVQLETGDVNLQMIGEHVSAKTNRGNITGERLMAGISAETGEGDITLMVIGPSEAVVAHGKGRIDVGGARATLVTSTSAGDLHVRAVPHGDWKLSSESGTVRLELPAHQGFELETTTNSGKLQFERDDLPKLAADTHQILRTVNGGGKKVVVHTASGDIVIR